MSFILYGISGCDTVRKACRFLAQQQCEYTLIDLRQTPPDAEHLMRWLTALGQAVLINKRSLTYREHKEAVNTALQQGQTAIITLLQKYPTLIKRPVIEYNGQLIAAGWQESALQKYINAMRIGKQAEEHG